jgi:hypothetical protein
MMENCIMKVKFSRLFYALFSKGPAFAEIFENYSDANMSEERRA